MVSNIIVQAILAFSLYSLVTVVYTLLSAWKNINLWQMKWDWRIWANGIFKYLLLGGSFIALIIASYAIIAWAPNWGVELTNVQAISSKVIFGVMALGIVAMITKCLSVLVSIVGVDKDVLNTLQEAAVKTEPTEPLVIEAPGLPSMPADYVAKKLDDEKIGGIGRVYSVPIGTFEQFMAAVNGNSYDIDGAYNAQCWDGAALLWQQLGLVLYTGNGLAIGCWDLKRDINKYDQFDLIDKVDNLRVGDVVVMRPNHIGFFVGWNGSAMQILGQNQMGTGNGAPFNVVNIAKGAFAGAFRYKGWNVVQPTPETPPSTNNTTKPVDDAIILAVMRGDYGNGSDRITNLTNAGYNASEVQAAVNNRLSVTQDITPATNAPVIGDIVTTTSPTDQNGTILNLAIINDGNSVWSETNGRGMAVLSKGGIVRAAVPISSLRKA